MLSVGIDAGAENTKVVVIEDDRLLAFTVVPSGWDTPAAARSAFEETMDKAGLNANVDISIGTTGMGGKNITPATVYTAESTCCVRGAAWLYPSVRTVIDLGAEQSQAMTFNDEGNLLRYVRNDQCAAGAGAFITEISSVLEMSLADLSQAALLSRNKITLNSTCTIFAESEVISMINEGHDKNDVARAVCEAIASKAASLAQELKVEKDILFIGGVARNAVIARILMEKISLEIIVPEEPRIVTAIGAALVARRKQG